MEQSQRSCTCKKKKKFQKNVEDCFFILEGQGFAPDNITVTDTYGNIIDASRNVSSKQPSSDTVQVESMLLVKDKFKISDLAYKKLASNSSLPCLKKLKAYSQELNVTYDIKFFQTCIRVYEPLQSKLPRVIRNVLNSSKGPCLAGKTSIGIRISGDGTWVGKRLHIVNFTFSIVNKNFCSGTHLLAILKVHEKYKHLVDVLKPITDEMKTFTQLSFNGNACSLKYLLAGDMKFLNMAMGIGARSSKYSCLWCTCSVAERGDLSRVWSMTDVSKGARTTETIKQWSKGKKQSIHVLVYLYLRVYRYVMLR